MGYTRAILLASVVLAVFAQSARAAAVDDRVSQLDSVSALAKPVTLTLRAASLKEVLAKVQGLTGAKMRPARDIGEDKATIRVKNRPARDVLRELARCFDLCWSEKQDSDGSYLYLWMDKRSLDNMGKRQFDDYAAITKQFDEQMQATCALVALGSEFKVSAQDTRSMTSDEYDKLSLRETATQSKQMGAAVLQYLKLTEAQRKDLLNGKHVIVSGSAISSVAIQKWPQAKSLDYWVDASLGGYLLKCGRQPDTGGGRLLATAVFDDSRYDKTIDAADEAIAKDAALDKDIPVPKEQTSENPARNTPVSPAAPVSRITRDGSVSFGPKYVTVSNPGEGSAASRITMSDGLLTVAETLDVPLVAQYASEYAGITSKDGIIVGAPSVAKKTAERIAELSKLHKFTVERDGDFLLAKSLLWHRLRPREIPEATIKRWQAEVTCLSKPTLTTALEMASLNWWQFRGVINCQQPWFGDIDLIQLASCEYALRLYASLNDEQRKAAGSGGVACSTLSESQQYMFLQGHEMREQPTFDRAAKPDWAKDAVFTVHDYPADYDLNAIAGMQQLAVIDLLAEMQDGKNAGLVPTQPDVSEDAQFEAVIPGAAKKLLAKLAEKRPDIASSKIAMYVDRSYLFGFGIGQDVRESSAVCYIRRR